MGYFVKNRQLSSGSTGVGLPVGNTANQPAHPVVGMIRYNTELATPEFYNGAVFVALSQAGGIVYTLDNFVGNGVSVDFVMSLPEGQSTQIIVFVGSIYQIPEENYTVSGTVITFSSAPPSGLPINVIHSGNS
jgi:hypothetical protein